VKKTYDYTLCPVRQAAHEAAAAVSRCNFSALHLRDVMTQEVKISGPQRPSDIVHTAVAYSPYFLPSLSRRLDHARPTEAQSVGQARVFDWVGVGGETAAGV